MKRSTQKYNIFILGRNPFDLPLVLGSAKSELHLVVRLFTSMGMVEHSINY